MNYKGMINEHTDNKRPKINFIIALYSDNKEW